MSVNKREMRLDMATEKHVISLKRKNSKKKKTK